MTALNHRLHWWQAGFLVIVLLLAIGSNSTILADETTTEHPASNNALTFFGTTWRSGFQTKLHSSNVASKETVKLSAQGNLSMQDYTSLPSFIPVSPGSKKISYNWWVSTDQQTFHLQSNSHDSTFNYTAPTVSTETTVKIQVSFTAKHLGLVNIQTTEYWSNVAFITVMPHQVPASGIKIKSENQHLLNSDTTTVHATLTPPEATDTITWSSDSAAATVDEFGTVTASKVTAKHAWCSDDHGQVTIKGTIDNMSASTTLTIGMLQDQTINEGGSVTFQLTGLPKDENGKPKVKVDSWHRGKISSNKFKEFKTDQDHFTVPLAMFNQDNDTLYYATLSYTEKDNNGQSQPKTIDTNVAKLTVNNTHDMSLVTVPSFQFGTISLNAFKAPQKTALKAINQRAITQPSLLISDLRQSNQHWQLSATLAPFTLKSGPASSSIAGTITADLKPVHPPDAKVTSITIGQKSDPATQLRGSQSVAYYLDNSQLQMQFNPRASPGQYHSTITWTLAAVP